MADTTTTAPRAAGTHAEALTDTDEPGTGTYMRALVKARADEGLDYVSDRPLPMGSTGKAGVPGPGEVMVKVMMAGVCGTDRHIWEWDEWAQGRIPVGIVTGHELAGAIEKLGPGVEGFHVGQRVSAEGHILGASALNTDFNARTGNAHIARDMKVIGVDRDGCFADYIMLPAYNLWPLPDDIPDRWGCVMDPLGNAVHTVMAAGVSTKNVLITGVGAIGLMSVMVAKAAGAARIFAVDIDERRLNLARDLGADECFDVRDIDTSHKEGWPGAVKELTKGEGADVLLEMSGAPSAFESGFTALRHGGTASLLGTPSKPFVFDWAKHVIFKGAHIVGIHGRRMFDTWYQMEQLLTSGKINLDRVITHEIPMRDYPDAFEFMQSGEAIKVILKING